MGLEMLSKTAALAAITGLMWGVSVASAFDQSTGSAPGGTVKLRQTEFGKTLPPIGFVRFCAEQPLACSADTSVSAKPIVMTAERWQLVNEINTYVNHKIAPVSDQDLYGQTEHWTYPVDAGDCEDYALLKQNYLNRMGLPESALLMTVVLDEKKEGHAVLTLVTNEGDFILDNRLDTIRPWTSTSYKYLKRQSRQNPRQWMALLPVKSKAEHTVATQR